GLGIQFLRHIERTRVLAHLIDVSDSSGRPDPVKDFNVIMGELKSFGAELEKKPMIAIASKLDSVNPDKLAKLRKHCKKLKLELYEISAVTGEGVQKLKYALGKRVAEIRAGTYVPSRPAARKKSSVRAKKVKTATRRIPKRAGFKKRKSG
ncbi:MAG TPA: hypothetical protein VKT33_01850, partial [Candidatus Angelobacter sp.]|nr:hypothetical protein [Candidatus Angelobacter sp.]